LAIKEQAKVTSSLPTVGLPAQQENAKPYALPDAPMEVPGPAHKSAVPRMQGAGPDAAQTSPPGGGNANAVSGGTSASAQPGGSGAKPSAPSAGPGKPLADEKLKQELLDAIRGVK
jgi:hypothetical protein